MRVSRIALILVVALAAAPAAVFACEGVESCACKMDPTKSAEATNLAIAAEAGCEKSMGRLIAMAKESGDQDAIGLAKNAEGGCEHSRAKLIALAKGPSRTEGATVVSYSPEMTELAGYAKGGCDKSAGKLIAMAKTSEDKTTAELAARAESGCEHSKAALIARVQGAGGSDSATK